MGDRHVGQDAVTEIEHMPDPGPKRRQYLSHFFPDGIWVCVQHARIEIALQGDAVVGDVPGAFEIDGPIGSEITLTVESKAFLNFSLILSSFFIYN